MVDSQRVDGEGSDLTETGREELAANRGKSKEDLKSSLFIEFTYLAVRDKYRLMASLCSPFDECTVVSIPALQAKLTCPKCISPS